MLDAPLLARLEETQALIAAAIIGGCILIYIVHSIKCWRQTREREQTRREIAAYVAEGSIAPDDAVRLLAAASDEAEKMIADGVAWGTVNPEKAERLIRTMRGGHAGAGAPPPPPRTA